MHALRWLGIMSLAVLPLAACTVQPASVPRFYAMDIPTRSPPAQADGQPVPGVRRTVRLITGSSPSPGQPPPSHTVVSDDEMASRLDPGHTLGMAFTAPLPFRGLEIRITRQGPEASRFLLTVSRTGQRPGVVAQQWVDPPQQGWVGITFEEQPPGTYLAEISNAEGAPVLWRGGSLDGGREDLWAGYQERGVPFRLPRRLADIPLYEGGSLEIPAGFRARRLYILGGRSTYDHGIGRWGDNEIRQDGTDRQFIGDQAGSLEVVYRGGQRDVIPLIFGWNLWWWQHWGATPSGGPFLEPFFTTPQPLIRSLHLYSVGENSLAPWFWVYQPQDAEIRSLRLVDNPAIQGAPLIVAITVEADGPAPTLTPLPAPKPTTDLPTWLAEHTITPDQAASASYRPALERLRRFLYTMPDDLTPQNISLLPSTSTPNFIAEGDIYATILSNAFAVGLPDLLSKIDPDGAFHSSSPGSLDYGGYGGIGTYRPFTGRFRDQAWSRDMGRSLIELARLGKLGPVSHALAFADGHLYDLSQAYPTISRAGHRIPPHWGTVVNRANLLDLDGEGDDNQENDGHGLLLLAHYRAWRAAGATPSWLQERWTAIRDAAQWFCIQLEDPGLWRSRGVLYSEGESANDAGYDTYGNIIAYYALRTAQEMANALGETSQAQRWQGCAERLRDGILTELTEEDPRYGRVWKAVAWNWGYGHDSLAALLIAADVLGYDSTQVEEDFQVVTRQTYQRQVSLPSGLQNGRTLGYGQAFMTQAALLLDDMTRASEALKNLAAMVYGRHGPPYLVPEGVAVGPEGTFWYRTGDLGNAVHEAEVLKTLALVMGVDDLTGDRLRLMPRPALSWSRLQIDDYPVVIAGEPALVSYQWRRTAQGITLNVATSRPLPLDARVGPLSCGITGVHAVQDGQPIPVRTQESGGWCWLWVDNLLTSNPLHIEVTW